ncbi:MAG: AP2 domain-containing protein [Clostridia bacterium]|nr:AP2 domain-containing protein [Clostridia bacterium]
MREYENLIGQRFGKLVVKELLPSTATGHRRWNCLCDCGNMHTATTGNLKSGHTKSCGCINSPDLTGKVFGKLTVIRRTDEKRRIGRNTYPLWECRCECGETEYRVSHTLSDEKERMCLNCLLKANGKAMVQAAGFVGGTQLSKIQDMKPTAANTSGTRGVYWRKRRQAWEVRLKFRGKLLYIGTYDKYEDAVKARKNAEDEIYRKFLEKLNSEC